MTDKPFVAHARATVTIEVLGLGSWGTDCTVQQIIDQASEAAIGRIRTLAATSARGGIKIIGDPKVTVIMGGNPDA